jgi:predicted metal-dependent hydrolase
MDVEVTRSARRKKTVQARLVDGVLRLAIPAHLSPAEERHWIEVMQRRFATRRDADQVDLEARARRLARAHGLPVPQSIEWSSRQKTLWGSCTVEDRRIRISDRVASFPRWVLDYVIVHELAHLEQPSHDRAFWDLVGRYPMAERARGYLIAKSDGEGRESDS